MRWLELSVEASGELVEPVVHLFSRHGEGRVAVEQAGGFNPDEGERGPPAGAPATVRGYLPLDATMESRRASIEVGLRLAAHVGAVSLVGERVIDDSEWLAQEFEPVRVGRRLLISPPSVSPETRAGEVVIPLEPGIAFGTGHHPTTRTCLEWLERRVRPGMRFLDVGTGSGILAIAALKLGAERALCLDVDVQAVKSAAANLDRAGVSDAATVLHGTLPHPEAAAAGWDAVAANISAAVLCELAGDLVAALSDGGALVASGLLVERRDEVVGAFSAAGGVVSWERTVEDWVGLEVRLR